MIRCNATLPSKPSDIAPITDNISTVNNIVVPDTMSKVLGEQPVNLDAKIESTNPKTDEQNEGMVTDTVSISNVTSTSEPESLKQNISSDDFFQELDEERKLADSVQQYYSTLKIERDPHIFKDRPFKPKNKKQTLISDSMIVETGSNKSVDINATRTLVEPICNATIQSTFCAWIMDSMFVVNFRLIRNCNDCHNDIHYFVCLFW
jgi:hypothetical protein